MINPKFVTMVSSRDKNEQQVRVEDLAIFSIFHFLSLLLSTEAFFFFVCLNFFTPKKEVLVLISILTECFTFAVFQIRV